MLLKFVSINEAGTVISAEELVSHNVVNGIVCPSLYAVEVSKEISSKIFSSENLEQFEMNGKVYFKSKDDIYLNFEVEKFLGIQNFVIRCEASDLKIV
jgi:hypothetical protein